MSLQAVAPIASALRWQPSAGEMGGALLLAAALAIPSPATAAPSCAPRTELLKQLSARYSEAPVAVGLASNGALIELLTSGSGATWTLIVSQPNGASCLVAAGESWQDLKRAAAGDVGI
jgi:hypothetical protein